MSEFWVLVQCFGSLVVPCLYLLGTRFRGAPTWLIVRSVALHLASCGIVAILVYRSWQRGDSECFWLWGLLIPVNLIFLAVYILTIAFGLLKKGQQSSDDTESNRRS